MRREVVFLSQSLRCAGWLYVPDHVPPGHTAPALVMAHALGSVKELVLAAYAEQFVAAGFVTLVFDYRYFGASEGTPRGQLFPHEQHEDIRNAITWLSAQPEVDPERIGVWGLALGGAHMLHLASYDRRIKAVVATVPTMDIYETALWVDGPHALTNLLDALALDRSASYLTGRPTFVNITARPRQFGVLPGADIYMFYQAAQTAAPRWRNQITSESFEKLLEYHPVAQIHLAVPTPMLIIAAAADSFVPAALTRAAYSQAHQPKRLVTLPCDHLALYAPSVWRDQAASQAVAWFAHHLYDAPDLPGTVRHLVELHAG